MNGDSKCVPMLIVLIECVLRNTGSFFESMQTDGWPDRLIGTEALFEIFKLFPFLLL